jgi:hypothetical protein
MSEKPLNLDERYGRSKNEVSRTTLVLIGLALLAFFTFAIYSTFIAKPVASVELTSFKKIDDTHIRGNFTALTGDQPASCSFKAYATRGNVVGFVEVEIPANNSDQLALQVIVKTLEPASILKADGCRVK